MSTITLDVMRNVQKGQEVFLGYIDKEIANSLVFCDHYPPEKDRLGYQRPPEKKRAVDFSLYIENNPSGFVTPILLNARENIEFVPIIKGSNFGQIVFQEKKCLSVIDGQHRTIGLLEHFNANIDMPFMLFNNLNTDYEQDLFVTINREQKKVSMSHVHFVGHKNDILSEIVIRLESDPESPWYHNVNLVGARGTKRSVSLQSLRSALEILLQSGEIKTLEYSYQYKIAVDFWDVVAEVWPNAWSAQRNSLLKKSMGTLAISKLGSYLLPLALNRRTGVLDKEILRNYLKKASHVNWMNDGDFKGFSSRQASDLVKAKLDSIIFARG